MYQLGIHLECKEPPESEVCKYRRSDPGQLYGFFCLANPCKIDVDSIVWYCYLSVVSFAVFLCVSICGTHCQPTVLCQYGARFVLDRWLF